ncbi:hypothetical protein ACOMHN_029415 [Nucella lapillus]
MESKLNMKLNELDEWMFSARDDIDTLGHNVDIFEEENRRMKEEVRMQAEKIDYLENQSRRQNLMFYNIPKQQQEETWDDCEQAVQQVIKNILNITTDVVIERAHRVGSAIRAKLHSFRDEHLILKNAHKLKQYNETKEDKRQKIGISEDFSQTVRNKRRGLTEMLRVYRNDERKATLVYDKRIIDDGIFTYNLDTEQIECLKRKRHSQRRSNSNNNKAKKSSQETRQERGTRPEPENKRTASEPGTGRQHRAYRKPTSSEQNFDFHSTG